MKKFMIFTDTGCDISPEMLHHWGVELIDLTLHTEDGQTLSLSSLSVGEFYSQMRAGKNFRTAAANLNDYFSRFEPFLKSGQDVLYLSFSGSLSNTANIARMAANELCESYPQRQTIVMDSLCASGGLGLLLFFAVRKRDEGAALSDTAAYLRGLTPCLCHWFTVDTLLYLKRGGRLSAAAACLGTVLNLKPVLHMDEAGTLTNVQKTRGRKQAIKALAERYSLLAEDPDCGIYFISHGDCMDDAKRLEALIQEAHGNPAALITSIGPVIGSHAGPGTLALFFIGKQR